MGGEGNSPLAGERVWVTGASSGIGRALARQLARAGALVIASARNEEALRALAQEQPGIVPLPVDVADANAVGDTWRRLAAISPYLNRAILNAGTCEYLDIKHPDWSMMQRVMEVNYLGAVNSVAAALPLLERCPDGRGHVVGVASLVTAAPFSRAEAYGASKAALRYFLDALRVDLRARQIDVTVINPGFVKTPLTAANDFAMPFLMDADNAARLMLGAIERRAASYAFPRRLHWLLRILNAWPAIWNGWIAPRLVRG